MVLVVGFDKVVGVFWLGEFGDSFKFVLVVGKGVVGFVVVNLFDSVDVVFEWFVIFGNFLFELDEVVVVVIKDLVVVLYFMMGMMLMLGVNG